MEEYLTIEQVGAYIGRSAHTINYWYKWKKDNPDHELAALLPDYEQHGTRSKRLWKKSDVWKLMMFKSRVPQGRSGIMGETIQRYFHKERTN